MQGARFHTTRCGRACGHARWIAEPTVPTAHHVSASDAFPTDVDIGALGSPIIFRKLDNSKWIRRNLEAPEGNPAILFSVSGAGAGRTLDGRIGDGLTRSRTESAKARTTTDAPEPVRQTV